MISELLSSYYYGFPKVCKKRKKNALFTVPEKILPIKRCAKTVFLHSRLFTEIKSEKALTFLTKKGIIYDVYLRSANGTHIYGLLRRNL